MQQLGGFTDCFAGLKYSDIAYVVTMDHNRESVSSLLAHTGSAPNLGNWSAWVVTALYPSETPFLSDYTGKDLTEEQVQRILTRISPLLRQWLKTKDILPFLKQRYLLTETEILHLKSGSLRPQEQAVRLVEFLMNKGSYGIGALYLCLIESSEQLSGLPAHYQLAGDLKQIG